MASVDPRLLGWIALGGALGAVLRYLVSAWTTRADFPTGTLVVNVLGSFVLALLLFHDLFRGSLDANVRAFIGIGVLGAFTTMSTLSYETVALWQEGDAVKAGTSAALNVGLSLLAAVAGLWAARALSEGVA